MKCAMPSALLAAKYRDGAALQGIGIGVPGIIDMKTGMLRESPNLPGWAESPVQAQIERLLGTRVILENDANVAALGEKWLGAARDVDDMAMLTLGTGVGGGIVLQGRIWHGMTGMAGEFGHMTVEPEGPPCGCGNRGCVEQYASATAVVRMAKEAIASGRAPGLAKAANSDPEFNAKAIYNLAIQGDEEARKIFGRLGRALGICIANLVNAFNLNMYVVGGGVSSAWEAFSPFIFEELRQRSLVYAATAPAPLFGRGGCFRACGSGRLDQDHHHSGIAGERCRAVRRSATADDDRLRRSLTFSLPARVRHSVPACRW